jgi:hypothetical protein
MISDAAKNLVSELAAAVLRANPADLPKEVREKREALMKEANKEALTEKSPKVF